MINILISFFDNFSSLSICCLLELLYLDVGFAGTILKFSYHSFLLYPFLEISSTSPFNSFCFLDSALSILYSFIHYLFQLSFLFLNSPFQVRYLPPQGLFNSLEKNPPISWMDEICCQFSGSKAGREGWAEAHINVWFEPNTASLLSMVLAPPRLKPWGGLSVSSACFSWVLALGELSLKSSYFTKSVISPLLPTLQVCIFLLAHFSYSIYLFKVYNFLNSFSIHFRGIQGGKGDKNHIFNLPHWTWIPRNTILK